jgi:hypothetical protein
MVAAVSGRRTVGFCRFHEEEERADWQHRCSPERSSHSQKFLFPQRSPEYLTHCTHSVSLVPIAMGHRRSGIAVHSALSEIYVPEC